MNRNESLYADAATHEEMEASRTRTENGKAVIRSWTNLRDASSRSKKKQMDCKKSGSGAPHVKKYGYNDHMQLLNKSYDSRKTADSFENAHNSEDGLADNEQLRSASSVEDGVDHYNQVTSQNKNTERFGDRKRRKLDEIELQILKAMEPEKSNPLMSFFQGLMSHLGKFDDSEILEFEMGVLQVISKINEKKQQTQPPTFRNHRQQFSAPQSASFSYPQPSCSSYFNLPPTYQTSISQPQLFSSQKNPFPNPNNQKQSSLFKEPSYQTSISQPQLFSSQKNPFPNPNNQKHYSLFKEPSLSQPTPSTEQYKTFGELSAATSPDNYPTDSLSPALSGSSEN